MTKRRGRLFRRTGATALAAALATAAAWAQAPPLPVTPTGPVPIAPGCGIGPAQTRHQHLKDTFFGRPELFAEPPFGSYVRTNFAVMRAKADPHKFTLYRSDFLDGTNQFSPIGASRFNLMASRLRGWLGPVVVEWIPEQPGLAEQRRLAVLGALIQGGLGVVPERVVIGAPPYPGTLGADAANYYNVMITRDQAAPAGFGLTPTSSSGFSLGGGGGGP